MKKILASLLVLAMCAPAMAATVSFADHGDGTGTFTITATENMVGLGIDVDATAAITDVVITPATFNIYPDAAYTLNTSYAYGAGGPVCAKLVPGEIALPQTSFALCFANLNGATTPGADGATVVTITFTAPGGTQVTIAENATRAGVIGTLGEDIALTGTLTGTITSGPTHYTLTTATTTGGTVAPATGLQPANQNANLVATPNTNWFFWKWTGSPVASQTAASTTIMMDGDKSVTANFTFSCQKFNFTKLLNGATDNAVNLTDMNLMIDWVNANKTGTTFAVGQTNPNWLPKGPVFNLSKLQGSTDNAVNLTDLNLFIDFVNKRKASTTFAVSCTNCGC